VRYFGNVILVAVDQEGNLAACIALTRTLLSTNGDAENPYLMIRGEMQLLLNDPLLKRQVENAVVTVQSQMPEIDLKTARNMKDEATVYASVLTSV
jgi:hypothetical protein